MINNKLLDAAQAQAVRSGEASDADDHIDWSSASTIAGAMKTQLASGRKRTSGPLPSDLRDELFGGQEADAPHRAAAAPGELPFVHPDAGLLGRIEAAISKRVLLIVTAISVVALVGTLLASNSLVNSFEEGNTPTLPVPMRSLGVAQIAGVWLGMDRTQNSSGVPATYLFTRPNWLVVTEPTAAAAPGGAPVTAVVAQANYTFSGGKLLLQPLPGSNLQLLPLAAGAAINGSSIKVTASAASGAASVLLSRPQAVVGQWAEVGGGPKYSFNGDGTLTIAAAGQKLVPCSYQIAGNTLRVTQGSGHSSSQSEQNWMFTFDGDTLLLYLPDPSNSAGAPDFATPSRLIRSR